MPRQALPSPELVAMDGSDLALPRPSMHSATRRPFRIRFAARLIFPTASYSRQIVPTACDVPASILLPSLLRCSKVRQAEKQFSPLMGVGHC